MFDNWEWEDTEFELDRRQRASDPSSNSAAAAVDHPLSPVSGQEVEVVPSIGGQVSESVGSGAGTSSASAGVSEPLTAEQKKDLIEKNKQAALERRRLREQERQRDLAVFEAMQWHI
jgi:hypothetical protein